MTWRKDDYTRDDTIVIYDENGGTVVVIQGDERLTDRQRRQADMIAAVPDLLEACEAADGVLQECIEFIDAEQFNTDNEVELLVMVQAAIAKARGE